MTVYQYIAYTNPDAALELCGKYGYYQIQNEEELANCLKDIVARKGENGLKDIMELHPDKDVVLELFEKKLELKPEPPIQVMEQKRERDCSCMLNADGAASIQNQGIASQTNLMILVAAMVVSISIISMKK